MDFLREMYGMISEQVDDLPRQAKYVPDAKDAGTGNKKKKPKQFPTTDDAQTSLINYLWANQNADAV